MSDEISEKIQYIRAELIEGMVGFMEPEDGDEDYDCGYTQEDIDRCVQLIDDFLASGSMAPGAPETAIMQAVEELVLELNTLNEDCEHSIIETGQREQICEIIDLAATRAGLQFEGDITEDWRDW